MRISKQDALDIIEGSKGKVINITFTKKKGETRSITGNYVSTSKLGYVKIKDFVIAKRNAKLAKADKNAKLSSAIRSVNLQTITQVKFNKAANLVN